MTVSRETFKAARDRLLREALDLGWQVKMLNASARPLKMPWIALPNSELRAYFKPRSIVIGDSVASARPSWREMRGLPLAELGETLRNWE